MKNTGSALKISKGYLTFVCSFYTAAVQSTVLQQLCLGDNKTGRPSVHCTAAAFPLVTTKLAGLVSAELNSLTSLKLKSK